MKLHDSYLSGFVCFSVCCFCFFFLFFFFFCFVLFCFNKYIAPFSNINQSALHLIPLPLEYCQLAALQCPRHTYTFGRRSMDYYNIPSNYLITLRSTKQSRLNILPKDPNTLALAELELTV